MSRSRQVYPEEIPKNYEPDSSVYILELYVGNESGDFPDFESTIRWIRKYRELASARPPIFLVFSNSKKFPSELTIELGAVVIDRNSQDAKELRKWIDEPPKPETSNSVGNWLTPTAPFKETLLEIDQSPWWRLDY